MSSEPNWNFPFPEPPWPDKEVGMVDLRWMKVTCSDCGKEYQCTPDTDYFHTAEQEKQPFFEKTADNGYCWDCFMKAVRMKPQPEPPYE